MPRYSQERVNAVALLRHHPAGRAKMGRPHYWPPASFLLAVINRIFSLSVVPALGLLFRFDCQTFPLPPAICFIVRPDFADRSSSRAEIGFASSSDLIISHDTFVSPSF